MKTMHQRSRPTCRAILHVALLAATLVFGSRSHAQQIIWDHIGDGEREVGISVLDELGDINGDGVPDFITAVGYRGFALVQSGVEGRVIKLHFDGPGPFNVVSNFGAQGVGLGLFDNDGIPDYAITAFGYSTSAQSLGAGRVSVYSGATHLPILHLHEDIAGESFGFAAVGLGDVNGDGFADIGVSATSGKFRIYVGPSGTHYRTHLSVAPLLQACAPYGDYDGDGFEDYLIGDPAYSVSAWAAGRVLLYSGRTGQVLLTMLGERRGLGAGIAVSRGGDWNGDGISEVIAGGPGTSILQITQYEAGVYVFNGADGSVLHFFDEKDYCQFNSAFGFSVDSGRDVNGDGVPDLIVGAPMEQWSPFGPPDLQHLGSAFVISGATKSVLWEYKGLHPGHRAGQQVMLIEDHDGDGFDDWMVGSSDFDTNPLDMNFLDAGRNTIFAGGPGDATPVCSGGSNSVGAGARLWNSGPISVDQNGLQLVISDMPQSTAALLIHGQVAAPLPFGSGQLCIGGPLAILSVLTTDNLGLPGSAASATTTLDLQAAPFTDNGNVVQPGDTWAFQALYRDQGLRNTTNALDVVFVE